MKRIGYFILSFCLIFVALFFAGCKNKPDDGKMTQIRVVGLGDSISAGFAPSDTELYSYYDDYTKGKSKINTMCFTNLLANTFAGENVKINAVSYAQSGDASSDLVKKLNDAKTYPDLNDYLADGTLKKLTEEEAVKAEEDLEAKTVVMLKKIAEKKGINTRGMKKAEIIEAIRG